MICDLSEIQTMLGLPTPTTKQLGLMNLLHRSVERTIKTYLGYAVEQASHTELLPDGNVDQDDYRDEFLDVLGETVVGGNRRSTGSCRLQLTELPVRSITSVYEDTSAMAGQASGAFAAATLLTAGTHYYLDVIRTGLSKNGHLIRIGTHWPVTGRTVKVTYSGGYSAAELRGESSASPVDASDIWLAVLAQMQHEFFGTSAQRGDPHITSKSLGAWSESYDASAHAVTLAPTVIGRLAKHKSYARKV